MSRAYEPDRTVGLPIGTRVWNRMPGDRARFGTVMPHEPEWSWGGFPVRWDDGFWEIRDVTYVTVALKEGNGVGRSACAKEDRSA